MALLQGRWFDFSVEPPNDDDFGAIWLEDRYSREQWYGSTTLSFSNSATALSRTHYYR